MPERWKSARVSRSMKASSPMTMASISAASRGGQSSCTLATTAAVQAAAPGGDPAAGEAGEAFDIFHFGRAQRGDAAIGEIALIVEGSGIAKIARQLELGGEADAVAVVEDGHGGGRRSGLFRKILIRGCVVRARAVNAQADAGVNGFAAGPCDSV